MWCSEEEKLGWREWLFIILGAAIAGFILMVLITTPNSEQAARMEQHRARMDQYDRERHKSILELCESMDRWSEISGEIVPEMDRYCEKERALDADTQTR